MIKTCESAEIGMKSSMKVCVSIPVGTEEQLWRRGTSDDRSESHGTNNKYSLKPKLEIYNYT